MDHLQHNRAHTLRAACTFTKITKIKKLIYYTNSYVLLFFQMSRPIDVSNLGPGTFTYKQTYFVFFCLSKNTRFIFQLYKSIINIDGDAFLLYNLQDPPGVFSC